MSISIEEQLRKDGFYVSTTVGVSMRPMLRSRRDRVILRAVGENERLSKWDLPLYRTESGNYLLHRVVGYTGDGRYIMRGDNTYRKETVSQNQLIGVMTEFYRGNRKISASSRAYRRYAAFWNAIYPLRKLCHLPIFWLARVSKQFRSTKQGETQ